MSVALLESPNNLTLFCDTLNANMLNVSVIDIQNIDTQNIIVNNNLLVSGNTTLNNVIISGNTNVNNLSISGSATIGGNSIITQGSSPSFNNLSASGNTTLNNVAISGSATISGNAIVTQGSSPSFNSITLATIGGTPTPLNYYEQFTLSTSYTGIWASPILCTIQITQIGNLINIYGTSATSTATTSQAITVTTPIPIRFLPTYIPRGICVVLNNSATQSLGQVVLTSGTIRITADFNGNLFTGSGSSGILSGFNLTYSLN